MEFTFANIIFDNSVQKPKDNNDVPGEKLSYPGYNALVNKIREEYTDAEIANSIVIKGQKFIVRYRSEKSNGLSWGGTGSRDEGKYTAYAIKGESVNGKLKFTLVIADSLFINEKLKNRDEGSGSWSVSQEDRNPNCPKVEFFEKLSDSEVNESILKDIQKRIQV